MPRFVDLTGARFGRLTVVSCAQRRKNKDESRDTVWLCRCDCGNEKAIDRGNLKNGSTNSCGCIRDVQGGKTRAHPLWKRWSAMISRCSNPRDKDFKNYGARGITVCERWRHFPNYLEDMEASYRPGTSIDRINNDRGYSPDNCRWVDVITQNKNRRTNRIIDTPWGKMPVCDAADRAGLPRAALHARIRAGRHPLFAPLMRQGRA